MTASYSFANQTHKVIVIGDSSVGKTSIINQLCCYKFQFSLTSTIGVDFKYKEIVKNGQKIRLQIWDTAGQERYQNMTKNYFKKANGALLVFDLGNKKSFKNVQKWLKLLQNEVGEQIPKVLIGSKSDLFEQRTVSACEANMLSQKYNIPYFQVSSKLNYNISESFDRLVEEIMKERVQFSEDDKQVQYTLSIFKTQVKNCEC